MLDPRETNFWRAALRSGLLDARELGACWEAIDPAKRDEPDRADQRLARRAVQAGCLTLWQAQQLLAGRTTGYMVDRYRLLDILGQGGMGRVFLAQDTRLDRPVAVKILSPERLGSARALARFRREARIGARLQHENLVRIYDFGESAGRYFLVMEYIEGRTIASLIAERGPMPPATVARLARQVALGLEHAHAKGLIHRDVNPYNILVTTDGTAKLADMGLAVGLHDEERLTRDGSTVGTFDYLAPEQAKDSRAADTRSDIYSLGCAMYHMCAGEVPFPVPNLLQKVLAHQGTDATPLAARMPGFPEGISEVVRRMMRKSPDDRYATPMEVARALEPCLDEGTGADIQGGAVPVPAAAAAQPARRPEGPGRADESALAAALAESAPAVGLVEPAPTARPEADSGEAAAEEFRLILNIDTEPALIGDRPQLASTAPRGGLAAGAARVRHWVRSWWP